MRGPLDRADDAVQLARMIEREIWRAIPAPLAPLSRVVPPELQEVEAQDVVPFDVRGWGPGLSGVRTEYNRFLALITIESSRADGATSDTVGGAD
jgi:hypothetical protein